MYANIFPSLINTDNKTIYIKHSSFLYYTTQHLRGILGHVILLQTTKGQQVVYLNCVLTFINYT